MKDSFFIILRIRHAAKQHTTFVYVKTNKTNQMSDFHY